jgi:hypothetical protein
MLQDKKKQLADASLGEGGEMRLGRLGLDDLR